MSAVESKAQPGAGNAFPTLAEALPVWTRIALLSFALLVWLAARSEHPSRSAVLAIIVVNAFWVVDSFVLLASGWVAPNGLGIAFVVAQAIAVGALAGAQAIGLRGSRRPGMANA